MRVSILCNKFISSLERSINDELQELQKNGSTIVDIKINANDSLYIATIIYNE